MAEKLTTLTHDELLATIRGHIQTFFEEAEKRIRAEPDCNICGILTLFYLDGNCSVLPHFDCRVPQELHSQMAFMLAGSLNADAILLLKDCNAHHVDGTGKSTEALVADLHWRWSEEGHRGESQIVEYTRNPMQFGKPHQASSTLLSPMAAVHVPFEEYDVAGSVH